jgi:hypothetical protein
MATEDIIPVRDAVEAYLTATGSSPSLADQILSQLDEQGAIPLDLLGDALPFFIKDGHPVVERARFDALMARVRAIEQRRAGA